MITRSYLPSRTLAVLAAAALLGGVTSAHAVSTPLEPSHNVTIYKQLGFAFGFTNSTPSNLFGAFGGGGGGGGGGYAGGGSVPQLNFGPAGGNFLIAPAGGGGGGGMALVPPPVVQGGAPIVQGGDTPNLLQTPPVGQEAVVSVPDTGVGSLGFALVLAGIAMIARRFNRAARQS